MTRFADPVRRELRDALTDAGVSMVSASRSIGRNTSWVAQFLDRGTPRRLPEPDRRQLAILLQIDERRLGAREPWTPPAAA